MVIEPRDFTVLVADDDRAIHGIIDEVLGPEGFSMAHAYDGEQAWGLAQKALPHLLFTDIRMPGLLGTELARNVRSLSPEVEIAMMSSHFTTDILQEGAAAAVSAYLPKPFSRVELISETAHRLAEKIFLAQHHDYLLEQIAPLTPPELVPNLSFWLGLQSTKALLDEGLKGLNRAVFFRFRSGKQLAFTADRFQGIPPEKQAAVSIPIHSLIPLETRDQTFRKLIEDKEMKTLLTSRFGFQEVQGLICGAENATLGLLFFDPTAGRTVPLDVWCLLLERAALQERPVGSGVESAVLDEESWGKAVDTEINRAFRLHHPLSFWMVRVAAPLETSQRKTLLHQLKMAVRSFDLVGQDEEGARVALAHSTPKAATEKALGFLEAWKLKHPKGPELFIAVAAYPHHGHTPQQVLRSAEEALKNLSGPGVVEAAQSEDFIPNFQPLDPGVAEKN